MRDYNLDGDPAWVIYDVLPGVPVPEAFLDGAGIDAAEPGLADRVRALQVPRMLEQLVAGNLTLDIAGIVTDRLRATLA